MTIYRSLWYCPFCQKALTCGNLWRGFRNYGFSLGNKVQTRNLTSINLYRVPKETIYLENGTGLDFFSPKKLGVKAALWHEGIRSEHHTPDQSQEPRYDGEALCRHHCNLHSSRATDAVGVVGVRADDKRRIRTLDDTRQLARTEH